MIRFAQKIGEGVQLDCENCVNHVAFCDVKDCKLILMDKLCAAENALEKIEDYLTRFINLELDVEVNASYRIALKDVKRFVDKQLEVYHES